MSEPSGALADLLEPSLEGEALRQPIYSDQALFFVAFFGGSVAAVIFASLNVHRLKRWAKDGWLVGVLALAVVSLTVYLGYGVATDPLPSVLGVFGEGRRGVRIAGRFIALCVFLAFYFRHRSFQKTQSLMSEAPSPWRAGIGASVLGTVLGLGAMMLGMILGGGIPSS